jgi:aspartyl-tRNA synthetase
LLSKKFIEINTPKLIAAASESGSEVFTIDNYFGKKAYLAQSPQFYKQMCIAAGFERVFEIGAVFRAENSNSTRHATEFTGFDLEVAPIISVNEIMKLEQNLLISVFKKVKKQYGEQIKELYAIDLIVPNKPFPIIKLSELFKELTTRYKYQPTDQTDLSAEGEKLASKFAKEQYHSDFLFVTDYDKSVRPFYHYRNDKQIPQGFDLIYNGVEITSGAKREHRIDVLKKQAKEKNLEKDVKFYLEFFNYGIAPHGGFGLGVDRLVMLILGVNIREATLCFRGPDRLTP